MKALAAIAFAALLSACGYHVAGAPTLLPSTVKTIGVAQWDSAVSYAQLPIALEGAVKKELIARTKYKLASPASADVVLKGSIAHVQQGQAVYDPSTGRATAGQIVMTLQLKLTSRDGAKVYWNEPNLQCTQRYEISTNPLTYLDESPAAMDRLAQDAAKQIVGEILNAF